MNAALPDYFSQGDLIAGRYLVKDVKRGGMGIVYLCDVDSDPIRPIALKTFLVDSPDRWRWLLSGFIREARTWIAIGDALNVVNASHIVNIEAGNRIVPLLAIEAVVGHPEYGASLSGWIHKAPFDLDLTLVFAADICTGMQQIQKKLAQRKFDIVHRDLKPQNIQVSREGHVKITDFGLAKAFEEQSGMPGPGNPRPQQDRDLLSLCLSANGICGTPAYMSPEQCAGLRKLDQKSDIYSFGCVLYEMSTRQLPFYGRTADELFRKHISERPARPETFNSELPPHLCDTIMRCLAKDPAQRPNDFVSIRDSLRQLLKERNFPVLMFSLCGFSALTDKPRLMRDKDPSREAEALVLECIKGIEYVIDLGLVKDVAEMEAIKKSELQVRKEDQLKRRAERKRESEAEEFARMGDSLYVLALNVMGSDRTKLLRDCVERYRDAQERIADNPQISFRLGMAYRDLGELMRVTDLVHGDQLLTLAREELDSILRSGDTPLLTKIGDTVYLLPYHALYHRGAIALVQDDSRSAIKDLTKVADWVSTANDKYPKMRRLIRKNTLEVLDVLKKQYP